MEKAAHNLRIDRPCPMALSRLKRNGADFSCQSCAKTVVDFRGKTMPELVDSIQHETCGVFSSDQLPGQQRMKRSRQLLFYCLTALSILGFSVKPLTAQSVQNKKGKVLVESKTEHQDNVSTVRTVAKKSNATPKRKGLLRRKKKQTLFIGCPKF